MVFMEGNGIMAAACMVILAMFLYLVLLGAAPRDNRAGEDAEQWDFLKQHRSAQKRE